jgi:uncharacterized membrane protein
MIPRMKTPALTGGRIFIIDAIRGLAIALMILDHSLFAVESIGVANNVVEYSRLSITRFSMPLFSVLLFVPLAAFQDCRDVYTPTMKLL